MILEKTRRLIIQDIKEFTFGGDPRTDIEGTPYPGDRGRIFDLVMNIGERPARILLLDTQYGRNELLTGRFIYGRKARQLYKNCSATVARALLKFFPDVIGYVERAKEHRILRAGEVMTLAPFIRGLKSQGDDFKRKPSSNMQMFQAEASGEINWGNETTRIFSDVCPASGSTMEAFTRKALQETNLQNLVFNCNTSAINALYRVIPHIPSRVNVTFITWEALFSVWRDDITLPDGQTIHAGTVINLNTDAEFPHHNPIAPENVTELIHSLFRCDRIAPLPDIPGEVGEKIQNDWIEPLTYDFLEFVHAGIDLTGEPWREKAVSAWNMPGVAKRLREMAPDVWEKLHRLFDASDEEKTNTPDLCSTAR